MIAPLRSGSYEIAVAEDGGLSTTLDVEVKKWAEVYDPIAVAHRGASGYRPDNSLAAFKYANKLNADMIELDIRKTRDGAIVCFHDAEIEYGSRDYTISGLTLKDLRSIKSDICTLQEAIDYIATTDMLLQIEFKAGGCEEKAVQMVQEAGISDRTYYGSFTYGILKKIKAIDPCAKLVYITNLNSTVKSVIADPGKFNVDVMSIRCDLLSEMKIAQLHLAGMDVYGWTIDSASAIKKYGDLGLDGVISNYPDRVK